MRWGRGGTPSTSASQHKEKGRIKVPSFLLALRQEQYGTSLDLLMCLPFSNSFVSPSCCSSWLWMMEQLFLWGSQGIWTPDSQDWVSLSIYETSLAGDLVFCLGNKGLADHFIVAPEVKLEDICAWLPMWLWSQKRKSDQFSVSMALTVSWLLWWLFFFSSEGNKK